jgi:hypothetical protein
VSNPGSARGSRASYLASELRAYLGEHMKNWCGFMGINEQPGRRDWRLRMKKQIVYLTSVFTAATALVVTGGSGFASTTG